MRDLRGWRRTAKAQHRSGTRRRHWGRRDHMNNSARASNISASANVNAAMWSKAMRAERGGSWLGHTSVAEGAPLLETRFLKRLGASLICASGRTSSPTPPCLHGGGLRRGAAIARQRWWSKGASQEANLPRLLTTPSDQCPAGIQQAPAREDRSSPPRSADPSATPWALVRFGNSTFVFTSSVKLNRSALPPNWTTESTRPPSWALAQCTPPIPVKSGSISANYADKTNCRRR